MVPAPEGIGVTDRILAAAVSIPISRFGSTPVSGRAAKALYA